MSPASTAAASMGAFFCQAALILGAVLILAVGAVWLAGKKGIRIAAAEKMKNKTKRKSLIAQASAKRRFTSVFALTLHCGRDLEKGMEMAGEMADNPLVEEKAKTCMERLETVEDTYTAIKDTGLFSGFYSQMIKTGIRSGSLDKVLEEISGQYEREAEERINRLIGRFEPTICLLYTSGSMYYFIINPDSSRGRGGRVWKILKQRLDKTKVEYQAFLTQKQGDARRFAGALTEERRAPVTIVAVGGDGTVNEIVDGLWLQCPVTLGYIPAGSGNDLARSLRLPKNPYKGLKNILEENPSCRMVDYGVISYGEGQDVYKRQLFFHGFYTIIRRFLPIQRRCTSC